MKVFCSALFIFAVLGAISASPIDSNSLSNEDDWSIEDLHDLKKQVLGRAEMLIQEGLTEIGKQMCDSADLEEPLREVVNRIKTIDIESQTVCALVNDHIETVFEPLTGVVDECGKNERMGPVATDIVKTLKSVFHYICSITGEQILELVNPCLEGVNVENSECGKDFEAKLDAISPDTSTGTFVEAMCGIMPSGTTCLKEEINKKCHLDITKNTWAGLIDAIVVACN